MPAAAVIPAPVAYIYVAAFKKLVVEYVTRESGRPEMVATAQTEPGCRCRRGLHFIVWPWRSGVFTLNKLIRSEEAISLNNSAWYDGTGARTYFVGFEVREPMVKRDCRGHSYYRGRGEIQRSL